MLPKAEVQLVPTSVFSRGSRGVTNPLSHPTHCTLNIRNYSIQALHKDLRVN